jgi:hypothetical protein
VEDKEWIEANFPTDMRFEMLIMAADNALSLENIQYVSSVQENSALNVLAK